MEDEGEEGDSRWRSAGGWRSEERRRTRNEEILSTFPTLHAASYPLRVPPSLSLSLSSRVSTSLFFALFFSPSSSASPLLLPQPRFVPSTTATSSAALFPSALAASHPLTSAIPQRSPSSLRAMSPRSALPRATTPLRQYDQLDPLFPPLVRSFVRPSVRLLLLLLRRRRPSSSSSSCSSSASSASSAAFSRLCTTLSLSPYVPILLGVTLTP